MKPVGRITPQSLRVRPGPPALTLDSGFALIHVEPEPDKMASSRVLPTLVTLRYPSLT